MKTTKKLLITLILVMVNLAYAAIEFNIIVTRNKSADNRNILLIFPEKINGIHTHLIANGNHVDDRRTVIIQETGQVKITRNHFPFDPVTDIEVRLDGLEHGTTVQFHCNEDGQMSRALIITVNGDDIQAEQQAAPNEEAAAPGNGAAAAN